MPPQSVGGRAALFVLTVSGRWWAELLRDMPSVGMLTSEPTVKQLL